MGKNDGFELRYKIRDQRESLYQDIVQVINSHELSHVDDLPNYRISIELSVFHYLLENIIASSIVKDKWEDSAREFMESVINKLVEIRELPKYKEMNKYFKKKVRR